jgi:hypothetical protein
MKMRSVTFSPQFLIERLQGKPLALESNLPEDAELLSIKYDLPTNQIIAVIFSESFKDIKGACPVPEFRVTFQTVDSKTIVEQNLTPKADSNIIPVPQSKPAMPKTETPLVKVQTQAKRSTSLMEEEFSAEQRKLLSFNVEGDFLLVKPIRFLKKEWDDINEVVRSIGGKWIKGDIISYWEVPLP